MNEKNVFELFNPTVGKLNVAVEASNLYLCVNDIAKILGISPKKFVKRHDFFDLPKFPIETNGGIQMANFIHEMVFWNIRWDYSSAQADRLENWVSGEISSAFRKMWEQNQTKEESKPIKKENEPIKIVIEILIDFGSQEIKSRINNG